MARQGYAFGGLVFFTLLLLIGWFTTLSSHRSDREQDRFSRDRAVLQDFGSVKAEAAAIIKQLKDLPKPPNTALGIRGAKENNDDTIFVSVASFRDEQCPHTVRSMYEMARNPRRLFLGIIQQNHPSDSERECVPPDMAACKDEQFCATDNIRVRKVLPKDAKGPTFGRYIAMLMYRGEKYFMMIDSHNRFVKYWDKLLIDMYHRLPTHGVITGYPEAWLDDGRPLEGHATIVYMCNAHFIADGYLRMDGTSIARSEIPKMQPFSAAGFLFADALLVQQVPFDPHLDFLFDGEEFLYSVRMWTHGWDIYAPSENLLFHYYYRSTSPKVWSEPNNWYARQRKSVQRVQYFLGSTHTNTTNRIIPLDTKEKHIIIEAEKYGLGTNRTLQAYYDFFDIDPIHRIINNTWCKKGLTYHPH